MPIRELRRVEKVGTRQKLNHKGGLQTKGCRGYPHFFNKLKITCNQKGCRGYSQWISSDDKINKREKLYKLKVICWHRPI